MTDDCPIDVGIDTPDGIVTIPCEAVSGDCLEGFLALFEPHQLTPADPMGLRIGSGDVFLIDRERVVSIEGDMEYLNDIVYQGGVTSE